MKRLAAIVALLLSTVLAVPPVTLSVSNPDPIVTETWTARIVFYLAPLEGRFAETCPLSAPSVSPFPSMFDESRTGLALGGFPIPNVDFSQKIDREERDGVNWWRVTLTSDPIPAEKAERLDIGPVTVKVSLFDGRFQRDFFGLQPHTITRRFTTPRVTVTVHEPPQEGRPATYCGAIGSNVTAVARFDANVCTAGDPLVLTLTIAGATDPSRIRVPTLEKDVNADGVFRVDASSVKSSLNGDARVFTWRVRTRKAGTVEFPSLSFAFFDTGRRTYRTIRTESIPVQVKAGAQVALGLSDEEADGEGDFPMPDGLDLDFPDSGTDAFTFRRAVALAGRATTTADFAAAAQAYADYLSRLSEDPLARFAPLRTFKGATTDRLARHCANLGALRLMGGDPRGALEAYSRASAFAGDSPSLLRGIRAACARLRNDPRADLPITRILFPFWFRLTLPLRIAAAAVLALVLGLLWWLAGRLGRGGVLTLAAMLFLVPNARAQWPSFRTTFGGGFNGGTSVQASVALAPAETVVGEPSALIFSFEVGNGTSVESLNLRGLPEEADGKLIYGELERLPNGPSTRPGHVVQRVRLPVCFLSPYSGEIAPAVVGMLVTQRGNGTSFSFRSEVNFGARCPPIKIEVTPMPETGRPADFSGAVGKNFRLRQRLTPSSVHPGDLVTAEYTLTFDGYFPTNVLPKIEGMGASFKTYEPKETKRTDRTVTWQQMIVPLTPAATNAATLSVDYYDVAAKRYATVRTAAARLSFVSKEAASTENTAVRVDAQGTTAPPTHIATNAQTITLRFAPSDVSPAVAVLPPGTPVKTLARQGAWKRVEAPNAIGWTR